MRTGCLKIFVFRFCDDHRRLCNHRAANDECLYIWALSITGDFIPHIVTNCAIIGRAEAFASKNTVPLSAFDGLMMGLGFMLVLVVLGAMRELIGQGTLFDGADLLLGHGLLHFELKYLVLITNFYCNFTTGCLCRAWFADCCQMSLTQIKSKQVIYSRSRKRPRARVTSLT